MEAQDGPGRARGVEQRAPPQRQAGDDGAGHQQRPHAQPVVQPPDHRPEQAHDQAARQQQQAGGERAEVQHLLHVDRQQRERPEQRGHHQHHDHRRRGERARAERAQIQQGAVGALQRRAGARRTRRCRGRRPRTAPRWAAWHPRRPRRSRSDRRRGRRTRRPTAATDSASIGDRVGSPTSTMRRSPIHSVTSAIGRTTRNTARQPRNDSTTPDTVGPIAGATEMTIERLPMTAPRRAGGTSVITVVISSGSMIAVPLACTMRAPSSTANPGASAATSVPALNSAHRRAVQGAGGDPADQEPGDRDDHRHRQQEPRGEPLAHVRRHAQVGHQVPAGPPP